MLNVQQLSVYTTETPTTLGRTSARIKISVSKQLMCINKKQSNLQQRVQQRVSTWHMLRSPLISNTIFLRTQGPESLPAHLLQTIKQVEHDTYTTLCHIDMLQTFQWSEFCTFSVKFKLQGTSKQELIKQNQHHNYNSNEHYHLTSHLDQRGFYHASNSNPNRLTQQSKYKNTQNKQTIFRIRQSDIKEDSTPTLEKGFCNRKPPEAPWSAAELGVCLNIYGLKSCQAAVKRECKLMSDECNTIATSMPQSPRGGRSLVITHPLPKQDTNL